MKQKFCKRCQTMKGASEFWVNRAIKDGLTTYCIKCNQEIQNLEPKEKKLERYIKRKTRKNPDYEYMSYRIQWPDDLESLLYNYTNKEIAEMLKCDETEVSKKRVELNVPRSEINRVNRIFNLIKEDLGVISDVEILNKYQLDCKIDTIRNLRKKYNIPKAIPNRKIIEDTNYKKCPICQVWKKLETDFYNTKNTFDKKTAYCKTCTNHYVIMRDAKKFGWTEEKHLIIREIFGDKCFWCGLTEKEHRIRYYNWSLANEHFVAEYHGGPYEIGNIYPCCCSCNSQKHTKDAKDFCLEKYGNLDIYYELVYKLNLTVEKWRLENDQV